MTWMPLFLVSLLCLVTALDLARRHQLITARVPIKTKTRAWRRPHEPD
jgi:hypothetical protein